jgi:mono/diheme cytochrome c family protein
MKKLFVLASLVCIGALIQSCFDSNNQTQKPTVSIEQSIERGKYLVKITGCGDCHSPKKMGPMGPFEDSAQLLSGFRANDVLPEIDTNSLKKGWALFYAEGTAMVSPAGIAYAANITSDTTGIGAWSFDQFKIAMTKGKWKGLANSRHLLPPMPWQNFAQMKEEDLRAIYDYLMSTKPVKNLVPSAVPSVLQQL